MTGTHVVEECPELNKWRPRRAVWKDWREALGGRAVSNKRKEEEEGDLLGAFFFYIYEFLSAFSNPPTSPRVFVPAELPARYAIAFVPAAFVASFSASGSSSVVSATSSVRYSVVSSANFVPAIPVFPAPVPSSPACIGPTQ